MNRNALVVGAAVLLLAAFAYGAHQYRDQKTAEVAAAPASLPPALVRDGAVELGPADAKVVVVEFFDPACDTCAEFAPVMKKLVQDNPGKVKVVERYAPLHPGSREMVAILEAAKAQDRYWQVLNIMFANQSVWASHENPQPERIWDLLDKNGLDTAKLETDMQDPAVGAAIAEDIADAATMGVVQTPEFFVNGKPLPTWGLQQLKDLVRSELAAQYGTGSR